jgi:hypothetical protein
MKTVFEIIPESFNAEKCTLSCELSPESFSYAIRDDEQRKIVSLGVYQYEKTRPQTGFPIALQILFHQHKVLSEKFKRSCLIYAVPRSVLIPFSMYNSQKNEEVLNLVHGDLVSGETIMNDIIPGHDLYNTYSASTSLIDTVLHQFPTIRGMHQYTGFLKKNYSGEDKLSAIFYQEKFVATLFKEGKYQLLNSYTYRTPEDVAYILLNICKQYHATDIALEAGGMIEENSALYKSIYNYFSNVRLNGAPADYHFEEGIKQYPVHFFNHLYEFDLCV